MLHPSPGTLRSLHDEELGPVRRLLARRHVARCGTCRGELQRIASDATLVDDLVAGWAPDAVLHELELPPLPTRSAPRWWATPLPLPAPVVVLLAAALLTIAYRAGRSAPDARGATGSAAPGAATTAGVPDAPPVVIVAAPGEPTAEQDARRTAKLIIEASHADGSELREQSAELLPVPAGSYELLEQPAVRVTR